MSGREALDWTQLVAAVDALTGREVAIRVVASGNPEQLIAVARGRLLEQSNAKSPSAFWPLTQGDDHPHAEQAGIYLHEAGVTHAERRPGGVVIVHELGIVLNLRPA